MAAIKKFDPLIKNQAKIVSNTKKIIQSGRVSAQNKRTLARQEKILAIYIKSQKTFRDALTYINKNNFKRFVRP